MLLILTFAGVIAGLIQYFVDFRGLPLYQPAESNAAFAGQEATPSLWSKFINFISEHWQFFGYISIGIAGAYLVPVINELTNNGLRGVDVIKTYVDCLSRARTANAQCTPYSSWYTIVLLGYGIVFGYSAVRIIRGIGTMLLGNIAQQPGQKQELEEAKKQINELKAKNTELAKLIPAPAAFMENGFVQNKPQPVNNYLEPVENELNKKAYYSPLPINHHKIPVESLHKLLAFTHKTFLDYRPSLYLYPVVDRYEDGDLRSIYSGKTFDLNTLLQLDAQVDFERIKALENISSFNLGPDEFNQQAEAIELELPYNCEHVVPQSWFDKKSPMKGDLHHLFTCETRCNGFRDNNKYFDFPDYGAAFANGEKPECGKRENGLFEPEKNQGIVARAVLYFLLRYPSILKQKPDFTNDDISTLVKWHKKDPVSTYELHRNQEIYKIQGNRNPFIDFPDVVDKIDLTEIFALSQGQEPAPATTPFNNAGDDYEAATELNHLNGFTGCDENPQPTPWEAWRKAESLVRLLNQINLLAPRRNKRSDGMIGDTAHQGRSSDHNPWVWDKDAQKGVVTALDVTHDPAGGCDCAVLAQALAVSQDPRIKYIIWNSKIMSSARINGTEPWEWREYKGANPHDKHIHISVKCDKVSYDSGKDWTIQVAKNVHFV